MTLTPQAVHLTIGVLCQMQVVGSKFSDVHFFNLESILPTFQRIQKSRTAIIINNGSIISGPYRLHFLFSK